MNIPGKQGKRSYIAGEIPNLNTTKYPLENNGTELGEYYLNVEICKKIAKHVRQMDPNIQVIEFYSKDKSTDLNAAGRKAIMYDPDLYISIHHNCTGSKKDKVRGYVCMTANGAYSTSSLESAKNIANSLQSVESKTGLPEYHNGIWSGNTYIGELNVATNYCPSVLIEVAFFNNLEDLTVVTNDNKNDIIAKAIAKSIVDDFHKGVYDNDQSDETKQNSKKETIIENDVPSINKNKNNNNNNKGNDRINELKEKNTREESAIDKLKSYFTTGPRTSSGRDRIKQIKGK